MSEVKLPSPMGVPHDGTSYHDEALQSSDKWMVTRSSNWAKLFFLVLYKQMPE
jgi:hypothetical protein